MTCPKCHKQFSKSSAWECPLTDTYICPECRVGLSDGVTDVIKVDHDEEPLEKSEERRLF